MLIKGCNIMWAGLRYTPPWNVAMVEMLDCYTGCLYSEDATNRIKSAAMSLLSRYVGEDSSPHFTLALDYDYGTYNLTIKVIPTTDRGEELLGGLMRDVERS